MKSKVSVQHLCRPAKSRCCKRYRTSACRAVLTQDKPIQMIRSKHIIYGVPVLGAIGLSYFDTQDHLDGIEAVNYSKNPPLRKTGAPGEGSCTDCHSGTTQSAEGTVTYNFSGAENTYTPGQSYTIDLGISSGAKNGFELTILDGENEAAGTFTAGSQSSTSTQGGRSYIYHSASAGVTDWSFTWEAPAADVGNLTVYYSFMKADNNGLSANDLVYLGQKTIKAPEPTAHMTYHQQVDNAYRVRVEPTTNQLVLDYRTLHPSRVFLHIIDASGKQVYRKDMGVQYAGDQKEVMAVPPAVQSGIYFVSLLIGNEVVNRRVSFP